MFVGEGRTQHTSDGSSKGCLRAYTALRERLYVDHLRSVLVVSVGHLK
jgi:hypothetical protein